MFAACPQQAGSAVPAVVGWPVVQGPKAERTTTTRGGLAHRCRRPRSAAPQLWQPPPGAHVAVAHHGLVQQVGVQHMAQLLAPQDPCADRVQQYDLSAAPVPALAASVPLPWASAPQALQQAPQPSCQPAPRPPPRQAQRQAPAEDRRAVDMAEVLRALDSLYRDELRPYGRILRKRLQERAADAGLGPVSVDAGRLQAACQGCPALSVKAEESTA
ncbi:unnamed protein product, partial [Prorocentrum cordatum]